MLRLHADIYWRKQPNRLAYLELSHRNPDVLERVLNQIVIQSTAKKCTPMQVIKYLEHGRTSTTEEQKWSSFQTNYANNSKSFANRSKSIIRNNLGLFKHSCNIAKFLRTAFYIEHLWWLLLESNLILLGLAHRMQVPHRIQVFRKKNFFSKIWSTRSTKHYQDPFWWYRGENKEK